MTKKEKFKKYTTIILWLIVLFILLDVQIFYLVTGVDFILFDITSDTLYIDVSLFDPTLKGLSLVGVFAIWLSFKINDLCLYIWSYKIYTGRNNWYKFFRDREKQQKLQNKLDYQNYLKEIKNK